MLATTGCSTTPEIAISSNGVDIKKPESGKGMLVIYRPFIRPVAYDIYIYIDGVEVISLPNQTYSWIELNSGKYDLRIEGNDWGGMTSRNYDLGIDAGSETYLKLISQVGGQQVFHHFVSNVYGTEEIENNGGGLKDKRRIQKCCRYISIPNL